MFGGYGNAPYTGGAYGGNPGFGGGYGGGCGKGYTSPSYGYGCGNGFALIVVLFILLIIVGAAFVC
ncbi:YjcZ family sporulation protein [Terrilactibacillus sp. BCM23-1]|uniref:YjcZ family sporulation protein n=1 Tax=Terrilactibacillus tamarindi TaxID=2599694 RepID=A0A6N8CP15_9BACI|nr:YjcZ family sporulation protein [Terrilactibacillus tamarindi]MTT30605.1 YjcZ family sporulation protein [Terrilactibacillus tamarindi]